jgi:hypothetical protein
MEEVRQMLSRCASRRKTLEKMDEDGGEDLSETLVRYQSAVSKGDWAAVAPDCDRLHSELPDLERQLEGKIIAAKERRLRLELSAATLSAGAGQAEQKLLARILRAAPKSQSDLGELEKQLESVVTKRLAAAEKQSDRGLTDAQLELARELVNWGLPTGKRVGIAREQTGKKQHGPLDETRGRVERLLAQLASIEEDVSDLFDRAREVMTGADAGQRDLQLDSLMFEAAERQDAGRRDRELDRLSGGALAELVSFKGEPCERLKADIIAARKKRDRPLLEKLRLETSEFARAEAVRRDAVAARATVLQGLRELGYEIRMNGNIWNEGTRIEAQRPEEPNYDIELSAAPNGKIQSKVRAYDHSARSTGVNRRDIEVEQSWCDNLRRLHARLEAEGIEAVIEDEKKPGSVAQHPLPARTGARDRRIPVGATSQRNLDS